MYHVYITETNILSNVIFAIIKHQFNGIEMYETDNW